MGYARKFRGHNPEQIMTRKSEWTEENVSRYVDLVKIDRLTLEEARKVVQKSIDVLKKVKDAKNGK